MLIAAKLQVLILVRRRLAAVILHIRIFFDQWKSLSENDINHDAIHPCSYGAVTAGET